MAIQTEKIKTKNTEADRSDPPGKVKIADALKTLLEEKDFNSITTAEIAKTSGVNEALIYRYFKDKRGLLHYLLSQYLRESSSHIGSYIGDIEGALNKLRKIIWHTFNTYNQNRIFAKILLIEVRNFHGYFESETYHLAKEYSHIVLNLIKEGLANGEIRNDVSPWYMMQIILGSVEHLILPSLIFDKQLDVDSATDKLCGILMDGVTKNSV
jgi:AcrR family transcriptional regulator